MQFSDANSIWKFQFPCRPFSPFAGLRRFDWRPVKSATQHGLSTGTDLSLLSGIFNCIQMVPRPCGWIQMYAHSSEDSGGDTIL